MVIKDLAIFIDSQLVANQVKGLFKATQPVIRQYLEKTKEVLKSFDTYSMEHIRRNHNKKAEALSKLASMTFEHLTKEVLVKVLANKSINSKEVSKITAEIKENWTTPIYEYLLSGLLPEDPKEARKAFRRLKISYKTYITALANLTQNISPWLSGLRSKQSIILGHLVTRRSTFANSSGKLEVLGYSRRAFHQIWSTLDDHFEGRNAVYKRNFRRLL
ncbi:reverse transcriptase domain-containing protein [Tanacetum coccineum]